MTDNLPMENDSLRIPPLTAVRSFFALGRHKSIRKAAAELDVTHTAVIRQVRILESWLGASLIETTSTGTSLNAQGLRFHNSLQSAFKIISDATAEIRPPGQTRELRICAPPGFATFWILPRLHEIQRQLPSVAFEIIPFEAHRFDPNSFDVEIAYGDREGNALINIELIRPRMRVLASPAWIDSHPEVRNASDLMHVSLIHERLTDVWRAWFEALDLVPGRLAGPRVGALTTVLEAVHMHQGPGVFAQIFVDQPLTRGVLQPVVDDSPRVDAYRLVTTPERYADPVVKRFVEWLHASLDEARQT
ncbi:LysR substrate-binding domain-containing protein [Ottowia thiooxydans]|uniref:LysR substrate-binding domain-containing protein n=1 Tax=Ottowia thiooxydans TaxID=219182 RepID=UPI000412D923|nr:LysR substrate-binding domain-containing protein [Ottowia thiooxydans]